MTLLTALEIHSNYPKDILITADQHKESGKWLSQMYLLRDKEIHKLMLSYDISDDFAGFEIEQEAEDKMKEIVKLAIDYIENN